MAPTTLKHAHAPHHAAASTASHNSQRGGEGRPTLHPLKQNPPSIAEAQNDFFDIDIAGPIRPPPSAITTSSASPVTAYDPHASLSPLDQDFSAGPRIGHQRSLTDTWFDNCQPFLNKATSTLQQHTSKAALHSPTKSIASFISSSRAGNESPVAQPNFKAGAKALQNWFNGSSAPVALGVARHEDSDSEDYDSEDEEHSNANMMSNIFARGPSTPSRPTTNPTDTTPKPSPQGKFSWLPSLQKNPKPSQSTNTPTHYHNPNDDLLNLNIASALFPHGPTDSLDPSSYHTLLSNAETLLTRFQTSYRLLSTSVADARAEQDAQADELDEAETRVRHLKMQLETMAARAVDQDAQMQRLMEEIRVERGARQAEDEARKRSVSIVGGRAQLQLQQQQQQSQDGSSSGSPRRKNRISNSSVSPSVDSGFESECESEVASVFSSSSCRQGCTSPTDQSIMSAASSVVVDAEDESTPKRTNRSSGAMLPPPPPMTQRPSTYEHVRQGSNTTMTWGCANCEGGAQSAVWGRLAKEREENGLLKRRVEALEEAVEGALNVVDGPWGL